MRMKRLFLAALIIGVALTAYAKFGDHFSGKSGLSSPGDSAQDGKRDQESSQHKDIVLGCPGRVEGASEVVNVGSGADGVITAIFVKEGEQVKKGDPIALIECEAIKAEIGIEMASLEGLKQLRLRLLRGSREEERVVADDAVINAEAEAKQARAHYERLARLLEPGVVSKEAVEKASSDLEVAEGKLKAAINKRKLVGVAPLPEEIAKIDTEIKAAQERVNNAQARLNKCSIKAPISGMVVRANMKAGELYSTSYPQPIISIADLSSLKVRAEVDERDIGNVHLGQDAAITADAYPNIKFHGKISRIGNLMGRKKVRTGDPAEKSDKDVLEVIIDMDKADSLLIVGLRVNVLFY